MNPETQATFASTVERPLPASPAELAIALLGPAALVDASAPSRCQFHYPNCGRCRLRPTQAGLCSRHFLEASLTNTAAIPFPHTVDDSADLSSELLPELDESPGIDIRQFLARLLVQLTKGRVSPRRAWVLSCISNQLLHSHRAGAKRV